MAMATSSWSVMASQAHLCLQSPPKLRNSLVHKSQQVSSLSFPLRLLKTTPNSNIALRLSSMVNPTSCTTTRFTVKQSLVSQSPTTLEPLNSPSPNPNGNPLATGPTRTLTTLFALAIAVVRKLSWSATTTISQSLGPAVGPAFFAAVRDRPRYLNTPLTVVAAGLAKWLDIYSGVLMVRVLLSWFPNIPWDRQPLSAIRDLCDPYLNLFRNIIPPVFDTLDISPLLAFAVLGTLGSILSNSRGL